MYEPTKGKTPHELVADLADSESRIGAYLALNEAGAEALGALKDGLRHADWQVRRWSAMLLDHLADADALHALVPLLRDPKSKVRLWAVHSLACEACKLGQNPIDVVPLLIERIELDESIRVRRHAVAMLGQQCEPDTRALPVLERIIAEESDRKLRLHAQAGLKRYAGEGLGQVP